MKTAPFAIVLLAAATPAFAQFGKLGDLATKAGKLATEMNISEQEERELGERVSATVRTEFGVVQDPAVTKYVSLLGNLLAKASSRPGLRWEFIVLDTEGVNAFAAPGGIVHITRGALGLIKSEAELAGVLGHEIAHITKKHTVNAIQKNKAIKMTTEEVGAKGSAYYSKLANAAYDNIVERGFDRGDEDDADQEGLRLANKGGYNPAALGSFLGKLMERNKGLSGTKPNGLFSTHPDTQARIDKQSRQIKSEKLTGTASGQARYAANVKYDAKPRTAITLSSSEAKGVAGAGSSGSSAKTEPKPPAKEEKKGGGMFGGLGNALSDGKQKEGQQASASAGGRALDPNRPDRYAAGGGNPNKLNVTVTPAEIEAFRKGIA
ncbi:MAG TPA: M48 family metalloprotease [Vicinamibacterales bacterium]|nr:M48 family metalloprotease [Vicinamibacterales bacterium]